MTVETEIGIRLVDKTREGVEQVKKNLRDLQREVDKASGERLMRESGGARSIADQAMRRMRVSHNLDDGYFRNVLERYTRLYARAMDRHGDSAILPSDIAVRIDRIMSTRAVARRIADPIQNNMANIAAGAASRGISIGIGGALAKFGIGAFGIAANAFLGGGIYVMSRENQFQRDSFRLQRYLGLGRGYDAWRRGAGDLMERGVGQSDALAMQHRAALLGLSPSQSVAFGEAARMLHRTGQMKTPVSAVAAALADMAATYGDNASPRRMAGLISSVADISKFSEDELIGSAMNVARLARLGGANMSTGLATIGYFGQRGHDIGTSTSMYTDLMNFLLNADRNLDGRGLAIWNNLNLRPVQQFVAEFRNTPEARGRLMIEFLDAIARSGKGNDITKMLNLDQGLSLSVQQVAELAQAIDQIKNAQDRLEQKDKSLSPQLMERWRRIYGTFEKAAGGAEELAKKINKVADALEYVATLAAKLAGGAFAKIFGTEEYVGPSFNEAFGSVPPQNQGITGYLYQKLRSGWSSIFGPGEAADSVEEGARRGSEQGVIDGFRYLIDREKNQNGGAASPGSSSDQTGAATPMRSGGLGSRILNSISPISSAHAAVTPDSVSASDNSVVVGSGRIPSDSGSGAILPAGSTMSVAGQNPRVSRWLNAFTNPGQFAEEFKKLGLSVPQGLTVPQAAGAVGSLQGESGKNLTPWGVVGDRGTAFGTAQWRFGRLENLKRISAQLGLDHRTEQAQQIFHWWELITGKGPKPGALAALRSAQTPEQAAAIHDRKYEISAGWHTGQRMANARRIFSSVSPLSEIGFDTSGFEMMPSVEPAKPPQQGMSQNQVFQNNQITISGAGNPQEVADRVGAATSRRIEGLFDGGEYGSGGFW